MLFFIFLSALEQFEIQKINLFEDGILYSFFSILGLLISHIILVVVAVFVGFCFMVTDSELAYRVISLDGSLIYSRFIELKAVAFESSGAYFYSYSWVIDKLSSVLLGFFKLNSFIVFFLCILFLIFYLNGLFYYKGEKVLFPRNFGIPKSGVSNLIKFPFFAFKLEGAEKLLMDTREDYFNNTTMAYRFKNYLKSLSVVGGSSAKDLFNSVQEIFGILNKKVPLSRGVVLKSKLIFSVLFIFLTGLYTFLLSLIHENVNYKESRFLGYLLLIFFLFVVINLIGMIPYSFTLTSHLSLTLFFSFIIFFTVTYLCIDKHKYEFFSLFLPKNTPLMIMPFLIVIEIISYIARLFSLAIRLFANMMSGHTLLHILAKFGGIMVAFGGSWLFAALVPVLIVFAVTFLEGSVAVLQSYVFSILFCIYLGDGLNLH